MDGVNGNWETVGTMLDMERKAYRATIEDFLKALDDLNRLGPDHAWASGATKVLYEIAGQAKATLVAWK